MYKNLNFGLFIILLCIALFFLLAMLDYDKLFDDRKYEKIRFSKDNCIVKCKNLSTSKDCQEYKIYTKKSICDCLLIGCEI